MTKLSTTIIAAITITLLAASVNTALAAIVDVRPDHDNFTRPSEPNTVQPHEGNLALGYDTIFFKFDIAALGGVNLVNSATLKLRTRNDSNTDRDVDVFEVADDTWLETTITPNNKPALGSLIARYDAEGAATLGISPGTSQLDDVDVTSFVQSNINNGDFLISIAMNDLGGSHLFLRGDEHPTNQSEHPWAHLVVDAVAIPEPATLSLLGMGGLGLLRRRRGA